MGRFSFRSLEFLVCLVLRVFDFGFLKVRGYWKFLEVWKIGTPIDEAAKGFGLVKGAGQSLVRIWFGREADVGKDFIESQAAPVFGQRRRRVGSQVIGEREAMEIDDPRADRIAEPAPRKLRPQEIAVKIHIMPSQRPNWHRLEPDHEFLEQFSKGWIVWIMKLFDREAIHLERKGIHLGSLRNPAHPRKPAMGPRKINRADTHDSVRGGPRSSCLDIEDDHVRTLCVMLLLMQAPSVVNPRSAKGSVNIWGFFSFLLWLPIGMYFQAYATRPFTVDDSTHVLLWVVVYGISAYLLARVWQAKIGHTSILVGLAEYGSLFLLALWIILLATLPPSA